MDQFLNIKIIQNLLRLKEDGNLYHRESTTLEFKESFNFAGLAEYFRDFAAFANNKGGYLIFGVKDRPKRELVGISPKSKDQFDKLDPETISGSLLRCFSPNIEWAHEIFEIENMIFGVFYVSEASIKPIITKTDEGKDQILRNGDIYYRYGGRTQRIQFGELENIINLRVENNNRHWIDLVQKIGKSGPQNAAILDTEKGIIEKNDHQILVIDEELVKNIQWIREGEFKEKSGAKTLKLIGQVQPIDQIEVIRKVKENKLKEYPFSATQLLNEIKKRSPEIKQPKVYELMNENKIKDNLEYSCYVFRNIEQEEKYKKENFVPNGTPSIYKPTTVDLLIKLFENQR